MIQIIETLTDQLALVEENYNEIVKPDTYHEHGSVEQTRQMLFASMYCQALHNLQASIDQLKILNSQLY